MKFVAQKDVLDLVVESGADAFSLTQKVLSLPVFDTTSYTLSSPRRRREEEGLPRDLPPADPVTAPTIDELCEKLVERASVKSVTVFVVRADNYRHRPMQLVNQVDVVLSDPERYFWSDNLGDAAVFPTQQDAETWVSAYESSERSKAFLLDMQMRICPTEVKLFASAKTHASKVPT